MQPKFTLKKRGVFYFLTPLFIAVFSLFAGSSNAQTVSTASGTNYNGDYSINNAGALVQTFVIENANATPRIFTDLSMQMAPYFTATAGAPSDITLYYSSTSMSGPVTTVGAPDWTQIATGSVTVPAALTTMPILTGMTFTIPANTQYRFAVVATKGMAFSFSPTPSPNTFTVSGVSLKVGNAQIAAQNVGYAGVFPALPSGNTPAFFGGSVTLSANFPCAGTPAPGNTLSTLATACPGTNFTLSLQNLTDGTGVTYQWQSSPDGTTWSNISGATSATYTTNITASTYYRCDVTCSGNTGTSTATQVMLTPPSGCYCTPGSSDCTDDDVITRVRISTLDNSSACSPGGYGNYTNTLPAPVVYSGAANPITVNVPTSWTEQVAVWIDYNQNGQFETSEFTNLGSNVGNGGILNGNINIPAGLPSITTRMRVRVRFSTAWTSGQACTGVTFGETEDYNVTLTPCIPVRITSSPASSVTTTCGGNASFTVASSGTLPVYGWEWRPNSASAWQMVTNGGVYSGATTSTLTLTNVPDSYNSYQYRALVTGGCSAVDFSGVSFLTVNPIQPVVSPASASICIGTVQQLSLTNTVSAPVTTTYTASTGLPLVIPDATPTGVWNSVNVSGIPTGSVITDVSLRLNINHTWVGDLEINLLAPNGSNMNLIAELDGGTGSNGSDNFTNTVISSTGTVALSGFVAPRTGTFRADRLQFYGPSVGPGGSGTGYQTVAGMNWPTLLTTMNGTWNLGLSDWFNGDQGTLTSWSLSITYVAPVFAEGTWAGPAGTIFTDAAATTAYTGTPATTVYVLPTATGVNDYTVSFTTTTPCASATTTVPVTVSAPVTAATVTPATRAVCIGGSTTFGSSITGGTNTTYQWQRSTDAGLTWGNISGANGATLTVSDVTTGMTGYRYRVVASSGACGSFTSTNFGTLTVNALPTVTIASPVVNVVPGTTTNVTGSSTPAAAATNSWSWTLNGAPLTGNTNTQTASVDGLGTYQATVTDVNGCVNTSNELVIGAEASDKLWIYPNPTPGAFQVRLYYAGNTAEKRIVSIYNPKGQLITSRTFDLNYRSTPYLSMNFDLSGMARGTYVVKVAHEYSGKVISGLVLVH